MCTFVTQALNTTLEDYNTFYTKISAEYINKLGHSWSSNLRHIDVPNPNLDL